MSKITYLNNHLEKYRERPEIKFDIDELEYLSNYSNLYQEAKKTTKIFVNSFKKKETYKELLNKLPKHVDNLGKYYLITVYWIAYINYYYYEKFHNEMDKMLKVLTSIQFY